MKKWITPKELAEELGVAPLTIYRMIESKKLTKGVVRVGRLLRLDRDVVLQSLSIEEDGEE